ncbi:DUF6095 family protein [Tenacibaculum sp. HL-MS23]|uniref:DUF6095 family protein n=1 Tax=unclassified Tenacibaculum TaxID=2635139 RepID=UPI001C4F4CAE|nr:MULTISPECIES: DUF6095 family protein [unclassified Tenacibaculum]QXP74636.1 hypothetical protein H0I30_05795 [Tenacibaculum sp. AHE14PA]QXP76147.1 hypothetical protein H0I31_00535 [Tenacibaculum sp. AHE15PA]WNW02724.1 DUF6095 family protein [Tenacibaculum sp. HL-MS23]
MNKTKTFDTVVRKFVFLLGLLILSPIVLSFGFKAFRIYTEAPETYIAYVLLTLGTFLILFTVYFGFKTIKAFLDYLFQK